MEESNYGILEVLPRLSLEKVEAITKKLKDLGVPDEIGPEDVTLEDLMKDGILKENAATKLLKRWKNNLGLWLIFTFIISVIMF